MGCTIPGSSLERMFDVFRESYTGGVEIRLGAEYMLDSGFPEHLEEGLLQISEGMALLETSYFSAPNNMDEMLYDVDSGGLIPVIAHPERYIYMDIEDYERLKEKDYYLQLNILSLAGAYGRDEQSKAEKLLSRGMYDFVGSDMHHLGSFRERLGMLRVNSKQLEALNKLKENNAKLFGNK